jgi:predicted nucleic acid-binding protein
VTGPYTFDTNVAIYAFLSETKSVAAADAIRQADFISIQVLNEFASAGARKLRRGWPEVIAGAEKLRASVPLVLPIDEESHREGMRIAARYRIAFYDSLMLAVALSGGARTIYSEDMQHGLVIDDTLRIVDPFR